MCELVKFKSFEKTIFVNKNSITYINVYHDDIAKTTINFFGETENYVIVDLNIGTVAHLLGYERYDKYEKNT